MATLQSRSAGDNLVLLEGKRKKKSKQVFRERGRVLALKENNVFMQETNI